MTRPYSLSSHTVDHGGMSSHLGEKGILSYPNKKKIRNCHYTAAQSQNTYKNITSD